MNTNDNVAQMQAPKRSASDKLRAAAARGKAAVTSDAAIEYAKQGAAYVGMAAGCGILAGVCLTVMAKTVDVLN